jgi:hypothetical protein
MASPDIANAGTPMSRRYSRADGGLEQTAELALEAARGAPRQLHRLLLEGGWLC